MDSRKQVMAFAMGAMGLLTAATSVIVAAHYWEMLSGIWLIAIAGLLLPDWAAWWATYWHTKAGEDRRVKVTAFVVAGGLALVMIGNAGAVMAVSWEIRQAETGEKMRQISSNEAVKIRADQVTKLKAAGMSDRAIAKFLDTEVGRDRTAALVAQSVRAEPVSLVPEPIRRYMAFWVYIVPFLAGLIGVFSLVGAIALPGGAEFGQRRSEFPSEIEIPK